MYRFIAICCLMLLGLPAVTYADPKSEIAAAIDKISTLDSYAWGISAFNNFDDRPLALFLPERPRPLVITMQLGRMTGIAFGINGKWERDGLATVHVVTGWDTRKTAQAYAKAGKIVVSTPEGWKTGDQIRISDDEYLSQQDPAPFAVVWAQYFSFAHEASYLLERTRQLHRRKDFYTSGPAIVYAGDLDGADAEQFAPRPLQPSGPNGGEKHVTSDVAQVTYEIKDGLLVEFEIELTGQSAHFPYLTWSVSIVDIGYSTIIVPDAIIAPLGISDEEINSPGKGKVVGLDYYYNHQIQDGKQVGYIWEDAGANGYSNFGEIWKTKGAGLARLDKAPTRADLDRLSVYIIASPSNAQTAADHRPNYLDPAAIDAITSWVNDGGVLVLFGNSKGNCDIDHLNQLAQQFGFSFKRDQSSTVPRNGGTAVVQNQQVQMGVESVQYSSYPIEATGFPDHVLFKDVNQIRINELCTLTVNDPAKVLLEAGHWRSLLQPMERSGHSTTMNDWLQAITERPISFAIATLALIIMTIYLFIKHPKTGFGSLALISIVALLLVNVPRFSSGNHPITAIGEYDHIMAVDRLGKGTIFAVGSPCFFNDNLDAKATAEPNDNRKMAENLAQWLLTVSSPPRNGR